MLETTKYTRGIGYFETIFSAVELSTMAEALKQFALKGDECWREEYDSDHDRVVERVVQPRVGNVFARLDVHERQDDADGQVHGHVLPLVAVHVGEEECGD
mgnify:CR=1 FL=1